MISQTISYYKILEKLGEVPNFPTSAFRPALWDSACAATRRMRIMRHAVQRHRRDSGPAVRDPAFFE
jgi:hypothetical protein